MPSFKLAAAAVVAVLSLPAFAGEQYVDQTGFAVSGYDVISYRLLDQAPVGTAQPAPIPGRADITATYNGATFAFATIENRDRFLTDPARYAPAFDGHCAYGVAEGGKVPGNPELWRIINDKLYLNTTRNVVGFWEDDIPGNITAAQQKWIGMEPAEASDKPIPAFTSDAPVK